jgi:hypothetical protein
VRRAGTSTPWGKEGEGGREGGREEGGREGGEERGREREVNVKGQQ